MVAPVVPIQRLQYGVESVAGTLVPATRVVDVSVGTIDFKRAMESITIRNAGSLATAHRGYAGKETNSIDYTSAATYDRLADVGSLFFNQVNTGTGTGAVRTWTFTPSDTADTLARYSFEMGGTNFPTGNLLAGATGQKLQLTIKPNDPWMLKQTVTGTVVTVGAITGALSLPSSLQGDDVLWTQTNVYIDPVANAYGTTVQAGRIVSVDFAYDTGVEPRWTLDNITHPYRVALPKARSIECTIVAEYDQQTEYTAGFASTVQRVQVKGVSGAKSAKLNINGYWDAIPYGNDNGVVTLAMKLKGLYDPTTLAADVQLVVVNGVTTLTSIP